MSLSEKKLAVKHIPADAVDEFLKVRKETIQLKEERDHTVRNEWNRVQEALEQLKVSQTEFEHRLEREAEELAEKSHIKLKEKTENDVMVATMMQADELVRDYERLEPWVIEIVSSCLKAVLDEIEPQLRWAKLIKSYLLETRSRWELTLRFNPLDGDAIRDVVGRPNIAPSIVDLIPDGSVIEGTCLLESKSEVAEICLNGQVSALLAELRNSFQEVTV